MQTLTNERATAVVESVEIDPRLTKFAEMYNRWSSESKSRISWKRVQVAMLANGGALLKQVEAIPQQPIMFGADKNENILFANGGLLPILTGLNYSTTRKLAKAIGLELFPCAKEGERSEEDEFKFKKSEEQLQFEEFTGNPLVRARYGDEGDVVDSWLEEGENEENNGYVRISRIGSEKESYIHHDHAYNEIEFRGIRGLVRAKA